MTTSASCLTFDYTGWKLTKISLQGQYLLEVLGAKGGDSTGNGHSNRGNSIVPGGLGGYSRGILSLNKKPFMFLLAKKIVHQTQLRDQLQKKASQTAEEQELATILVIVQFQEQEEVQRQFESEVNQNTGE